MNKEKKQKKFKINFNKYLDTYLDPFFYLVIDFRLRSILRKSLTGLRKGFKMKYVIKLWKFLFKINFICNEKF